MSQVKNYVDVRELHSRELRHAYSGVLLVSDDKEEFGICLRDSGFEFQYMGKWYEAKAGSLSRFGEKKNFVTIETLNAAADAMKEPKKSLPHALVEALRKQWYEQYGEQLAKVTEERDRAVECITELKSLEYHSQGMGCGLEDNCITDRYDAMAYGWEHLDEEIYRIADDFLSSLSKEP